MTTMMLDHLQCRARKPFWLGCAPRSDLPHVVWCEEKYSQTQIYLRKQNLRGWNSAKVSMRKKQKWRRNYLFLYCDLFVCTREKGTNQFFYSKKLHENEWTNVREGKSSSNQVQGVKKHVNQSAPSSSTTSYLVMVATWVWWPVQVFERSSRTAQRLSCVATIHRNMVCFE